MEEWRSIEGFPGYEVSSLGRIGSWISRRNAVPGERSIRALTTAARYPTVSLCRDGKCHTRYVHEAVCTAFHGHRPLGCQVRHFPDRDPTNCRADNLSWGTPMDNTADKYAHGTVRFGDTHQARKDPSYLPRGSGHVNAKLDEDKVRDIRNRLHAGEGYRSIAAAFGVTETAIACVKHRKTWRHVT